MYQNLHGEIAKSIISIKFSKNVITMKECYPVKTLIGMLCEITHHFIHFICVLIFVIGKFDEDIKIFFSVCV